MNCQSLLLSIASITASYRWAAAGILCSGVLLCASCNSQNKTARIETTRFAMGTVIEFTVLHNSNAEALEALDAASKEISRIDKLFYEENEQSPISAFNRSPRDMTLLPREVFELLKRSVSLSQATGGAFDAAIGALLRLYDYDAESPRPPSNAQISEVLQSSGSRHLVLSEDDSSVKSLQGGLELAMGGIAKGYAVDQAIAVLKRHGVRGALINAGGDLRAIPRSDGKPWAIGVQHPRSAGKLFKVITIHSEAVATSGDYQKFFISEGVRYHHLLDPGTGLPARSCQSTSVIAPTAELADALATALFVLGPERGKALLARFPDCHALWILEDDHVVQSEGMSRYLRR